MADFTKSITNAVNLFGINPSNKWGQAVFPYTMTWGTTKWGQGTFSLVISFQKAIADAISLDDTVSKQTNKVIANSQAVTNAMTIERLSDGIWNIVFVSDTTNAQDRDFATWSGAAATSVSFTCAAAGSTTWS